MALLELVIGLSFFALFYVLGCGLPWSQENREERARMRDIKMQFRKMGVR